jgi:NADH-quinone oxidoreductase subunit C
VGLVVGSNPMSMDAIAALLVERLGADLEDVRIQEPDTVIVKVAREKLKDVAARLKADPEVGYETLNWIAGVDRRTGFEAVYHVYSWKTNTWIELHVAVPKDDPEVATVTDVWPAADWHEREAWDMVGIRFTGHPDLRRILLKDDFIGHPLRKDYVDLAENHPHV